MRVLLVDDDELTRVTHVRGLRRAGYEVEAAESGEQALQQLSTGPCDVVLTDLRMPGMDGLELLRAVRTQYPDVDVILMTAHASVETAVAALKEGASDYLAKPFRMQQLEHRLGKLAELRGYRLELDGLKALLEPASGIPGLVGQAPPMRVVAERIRAFASHNAPALITGETGTGKEMVSRALHQLGPRARRPLVPVACAAIPADLAESELFGHEKGAFTGATGQRFGAFERADGGTLLLDDVDDLPPPLQAKLLRALEQQRFVRVGASRETTVNVRVIATTKVELSSAVKQGAFREDLYYRLRGLEIHLPPLRERGTDIVLLTHHFLRKLCPGAEIDVHPDAMALLRRYPWPGNVRELHHAIESAVTFANGAHITPQYLPDFLHRETATEDRWVTLHLDGRESVPFQEIVQQVEQDLIRWAMTQAGGQQKRAAEILSLPRTTLQSKLGGKG
jgi:DNA-binding NtrC family response regulator